jgi:preprotein translocase subunit SecE
VARTNRKRAKDRSRSATMSRRAEADAGGLETPSPIEHATPDAELADIQLAVGRPRNGAHADRAQPEANEEPLEGEALEQQAMRGAPRVPARRQPEHAARGEGLPSRTANFVRGSWRELQRVQWPDRRQVTQATGVVIGFVIVAGVFLGVSDLVASKLINFIINH